MNKPSTEADAIPIPPKELGKEDKGNGRGKVKGGGGKGKPPTQGRYITFFHHFSKFSCCFLILLLVIKNNILLPFKLSWQHNKNSIMKCL